MYCELWLNVLLQMKKIRSDVCSVTVVMSCDKMYWYNSDISSVCHQHGCWWTA